MTKSELEQKIEELEAEKVALGTVIESQAMQIREFQAIAAEAVQLRDDNADLIRQVAELQAKVDAAKGGGAYMELATGWIDTSIGKRAMSEPTIDTAPFLLGVMCGSYPMIQKQFRYILTRLGELGKPASKVEMGEIQDLLVRTGFASPTK